MFIVSCLSSIQKATSKIKLFLFFLPFFAFNSIDPSGFQKRQTNKQKNVMLLCNYGTTTVLIHCILGTVMNCLLYLCVFRLRVHHNFYNLFSEMLLFVVCLLFFSLFFHLNRSCHCASRQSRSLFLTANSIRFS